MPTLMSLWTPTQSHIIHPNSFILLGQIEEAIAEAMPHNVAAIAQSATYVDWAKVEDYAVSHSRACKPFGIDPLKLDTLRHLDKSALETDCACGRESRLRM